MDAVHVDVAVLSFAAAADLASTHHALGRCATCYEGNPLMSEPAVSVAIKAAGIAVTTVGCRELRKRGHGRAAKVARWAVVAFWMGLAVNNAHQARGTR